MLYFIVSPYPKTGSTFLLELLNQHPASEGKIYLENVPLCHMLNGLGQLKENSSQSFFELFKKINNNWETYFTEMILKNILHNEAESKIYGCKFTWLKYPWLLNYFFPESKILYLIRDPRDSYASYVTMKKNRKEIAFNVEYWCENFFKNLHGAENINNTLFLDYEDLIFNYQNTCRSIFNFLEIEDVKIKPETFGRKIFIKRSEQGNLKSNLDSDGICRSRTARYKLDLSNYEIDYIEKTAMEYYDTFKQSKRTWIRR